MLQRDKSCGTKGWMSTNAVQYASASGNFDRVGQALLPVLMFVSENEASTGRSAGATQAWEIQASGAALAFFRFRGPTG